MYTESKYSADMKIGHDIAAIKIISTTNMPICLPTKLSPPPVENIITPTNIFTFGFGAKDGAVIPGPIKINQFEVKSQLECEEHYKSVDLLDQFVQSE